MIAATSVLAVKLESLRLHNVDDDARGEFVSGADHMGSVPTIQEPYR